MSNACMREPHADSGQRLFGLKQTAAPDIDRDYSPSNLSVINATASDRAIRGGGCVPFCTENVGAGIKGFEVEAVAHPVPELQLSASAGHTDLGTSGCCPHRPARKLRLPSCECPASARMVADPAQEILRKRHAPASGRQGKGRGWARSQKMTGSFPFRRPGQRAAGAAPPPAAFPAARAYPPEKQA